MGAFSGTKMPPPFGCATIIAVMQEIRFRLFPVNVAVKTFTHIPSVFVDGHAVLVGLPFMECSKCATAPPVRIGLILLGYAGPCSCRFFSHRLINSSYCDGIYRFPAR